MNAKLSFDYDCQRGILYINKRTPNIEQESEAIKYGVIARRIHLS